MLNAAALCALAMQRQAIRILSVVIKLKLGEIDVLGRSIKPYRWPEKQFYRAG